MIQSRKLRWIGHVACMRDKNAYKMLVNQHEANRPLGTTSPRFKNNIKLDLKEI